MDGSLVSRSGVVEAARVALSAQQSAGSSEPCAYAVVRMFDATVGIAYLPDVQEIERRRRLRLGAVTRLDLLDVVMNLPVGLPISVGDLTSRERRIIGQAPAGVVEVEGGYYVRRARAPISARLAVVASRTWQEGLRSAGRFAPFCSRAMLLRSIPTDLAEAQLQASFFGIGICVSDASGLRTLVEPQLYVRQRHSCGQWLFAEKLYEKTSASELAR
ncbi:hypothetical protein [Nocardia sp. NPDC003979]